MSLRILYAHLGLVEPGTAATDRDGDVWCVWPDGMCGNGGPVYTPDLAAASSLFGPFDVIATGLTEEQCDEIAVASDARDRTWARGLALNFTNRDAPESGTLETELPVESIDGPNGLRHHARLIGGRLGPDGQPVPKLAIGMYVRLKWPAWAAGQIKDGPDPHGRWQVAFPHTNVPTWCAADELEIVQ